MIDKDPEITTAQQQTPSSRARPSVLKTPERPQGSEGNLLAAQRPVPSWKGENLQPSGHKKLKVKQILQNFVNAHSFDEWKRKQNLSPGTKVFIVTGGYPDLKRALRQRGWVENPDWRSAYFDLKWTLQTKEISFDSLADYQIVNHFQKMTCLTTKIGLCRSLRNLIWYNNVDINQFYPRCYDLSDQQQVEEFTRDFKLNKVSSTRLTGALLQRGLSACSHTPLFEPALARFIRLPPEGKGNQSQSNI